MGGKREETTWVQQVEHLETSEEKRLPQQKPGAFKELNPGQRQTAANTARF